MKLRLKKVYLSYPVFVGALTIVLFLSGFVRDVKKSGYPFYVYNFGGLTNCPPKEQERMLAELGYEGMALSIENDADEAVLGEYLRYAKGRKNFKIISTFVRYNFDDPAHKKNCWKRVMDKIAGSQTQLWIIFGPRTSTANEAEIDSVLKEATSYAAINKTPIVLYPHSSCLIESAEQAMLYVKRNGSAWLSLAVHLCHEIRAGNGKRMSEVINTVKPYIGAVTLAGTDSVADYTNAFTRDTSTIKPLDRGNFDLTGFLTSLKHANYNGPIGFINFKIPDKPAVYLKNSIVKWNALKSKVLN